MNGAAIAGRPEGPLVAAATSAGVRLLDLRATALDRRTCAITGRTLDRAGSAELVGTSTPVDLCPGLPPLAVRTSEEPSDA